jgi:hypothetical protein
MKAIILTTLCASLLLTAHTQDLKKLNVFVTDAFDPKASITVPDFNDPLLASTDLSSALVMNGFKVISDRVVADRLEIRKTSSGSDEDLTVERKLDIKSVYAVKLTYQSRADTGCGGRVISRLSGQIVNLDNDGEIVATFSFKQGALWGRCTSDIMNALAKKLKDKATVRY